MKRALPLPVLLIGLLGRTSGAEAQSFHEKVTASEITKGGEVVGLRLKLTLRPQANANQTKVRVSLGPAATTQPADYRNAVSDPSKGYLLHQWPEIAIDPAKDTAKEVTLEVLYADVPGLTPGSKVEVISTWNAPSNETYWHVWGLQSVYADPGSLVTLPEPKAAAAGSETAAAGSETAAATTRTAARRTAARRLTARRTTLRRTATRRTATRRTAMRRAALRRPALRARARLRGR